MPGRTRPGSTPPPAQPPRAPGRGATLEQVAARAGVGRGTASRVINGSTQVSERSRRAVEAAVVELGYIPNAAARTLKTRRTDAVALVIAESEDRIFGEPFFAGVVRGTSAALSLAGKQLVLLLSQAGRRSARLENYLSPQHVDGVLLLSLHDDDLLPEVVASRGLPMVVGGRWGAAAAAWVDVDNEQGGRLAATLLLEVGCRHVGTVTGPLDMRAGRDRYLGFRAALGEAGRALSESLVAHGDFSHASGVRATTGLLAREPDVDGIFCANDLMAAAALQVLRDAGRRVPEDVCVVGFDDAPLALTTQPALTTVRQDSEEMGRAMVELLVDQIEHPGRTGTRMLPTTLVERDSTRQRVGGAPR